MFCCYFWEYIYPNIIDPDERRWNQPAERYSLSPLFAFKCGYVYICLDWSEKHSYWINMTRNGGKLPYMYVDVVYDVVSMRSGHLPFSNRQWDANSLLDIVKEKKRRKMCKKQTNL